MDDLISRKAAVDAIKNNIMPTKEGFYEPCEVFEVLSELPSAQPEPIKIQIDHELTHDEFERLRKDMADAPIMLLPSAQLEQKQKDPDVIKVIRCKDCKHWSEGYVYSYCQRLLNKGVLKLGAIITAKDDFCSRAEKPEEGDE